MFFTFIIPKLGSGYNTPIFIIPKNFTETSSRFFLIEQSSLISHFFGIIGVLISKECDLQGTIVKALAGFYYVESDGHIYQTRARGNFRKKGQTPYVGGSGGVLCRRGIRKATS